MERREVTETISISQFKATCLAVLERVRRTGKPITVTKHGEPVADVVPTTPSAQRREWFGGMRHRGRIIGDIIGPAADPGDWEVLRD